MIKEKISARFAQIAEERGIKIFDIAVQCPNLSPQTVYNVVKGVTNTKIDTLAMICKGMGISLRDFFDWDGEEHYTLSEDEIAIIEYYRRMDDREKARASGYYKAIVDAKE